MEDGENRLLHSKLGPIDISTAAGNAHCFAWPDRPGPALCKNANDPKLDIVAAILTDGVIASMGKFSTLHVKAHQTPTVATATNAENSRLARRSDADYVVTGNLRSGGTANNGTTISFQLGDAQTGNSVWSTSLEAGPELVSSSAAQDEMAGRAGAVIGGFPGAIVSAEYKRAQATPVGELTSYECIVQGVYALALQSPSVTVKARECLERVTQQEPANAIAWAAFSGVMLVQRHWGFGLPEDQAKSIEKRVYLNDAILAASQRAAELAPD